MATGKYQYWLTDDGRTLLQGWARDGLTDEQIAHNIGITATTLYVWKNKYPEISEALKKGKEIADYEVENALFKRATGYEYCEDSVEIGPQGKKIKQTMKHVPPDTGAIAIWLKNRRPDKWRDKPVELSNSETSNLLEAIADSTSGEIDTDDLPEVE